MQENQIKALIKLISKEDDESNMALKRELASVIKTHPAKIKNILSSGCGAPVFLYEMIEDDSWDNLKKGFIAFANKINPDLEEGLYLISRFLNPTLPKVFIDRRLEELSALMRPAMINSADYYEAVSGMSVLLFKSLGFSTAAYGLRPGDIAFYSFLREKRGSALCIASLYYILGSRYGLEVNIVDVAGRVLVQFVPPGAGVFYVDPADSGKIIGEEECRMFAEVRGVEWDSEFTAPLSSRYIIRRFLANLVFVYNKQRDERRLRFLRSYLNILEN